MEITTEVKNRQESLSLILYAVIIEANDFSVTQEAQWLGLASPILPPPFFVVANQRHS